MYVYRTNYIFTVPGDPILAPEYMYTGPTVYLQYLDSGDPILAPEYMHKGPTVYLQYLGSHPSSGIYVYKFYCIFTVPGDPILAPEYIYTGPTVYLQYLEIPS